jgi:hypothetical protein
MADAIAFIFSVPGSSFKIYKTRYRANSKPIMPASGAEYNNESVIAINPPNISSPSWF